MTEVINRAKTTSYDFEDHKIKEIIELYNSGLNVNKVAKLVHIDTKKVIAILKESGIVFDKSRNYRKDIDVDKAVMLYDTQHLSIKKLAVMFGIGESTMSRKLEEHPDFVSRMAANRSRRGEKFHRVILNNGKSIFSKIKADRKFKKLEIENGDTVSVTIKVTKRINQYR